MRRQISSKSEPCTEDAGVDAAGISAKVGAHYPWRSAGEPAEVSRGHSRLSDRAEGPNVWKVTGA
jgi:hypothetical protein